mgnify:CR=1 FL=1
MVNWQQVQADAAINAMNALLSNSFILFILQFIFKKEVADLAVSYADNLVKELKKRQTEN